ncbi:uncharacterized protein LY79DRAFT_312977 [Colletotrichum navitas]|uniref:Uncharacterized protein n=1 Tax=Colletotrichum navitas TaxID=681940 RepID=A0AAD8PT64_9PEZI|nr:uncharacterized protein LY79DRAFT_312977 [Colletotrichum navitas]KAK1580249.1 hypothetical protein LY79DRAFT_312977 [Colletotrichum navitas]
MGRYRSALGTIYSTGMRACGHPAETTQHILIFPIRKGRTIPRPKHWIRKRSASRQSVPLSDGRDTHVMASHVGQNQGKHLKCLDRRVEFKTNMQTMDRAALLQVGTLKRDGVWGHSGGGGGGDDLMIEQPELRSTSTHHGHFDSNTKPPVSRHSPSRFGASNGLETHLRKRDAVPVTLASSLYYFSFCSGHAMTR